MKKIISFMLTIILVVGMLPISAVAASTPEEALGEVNIYSGGYSMNYLAVNGKVQTQSYTYFLYRNSQGETQEIPAYCVNPNQYGVPQTVPEGESIRYLAEEKASDPKVVGLIANMYPHRSLEELGLDNKYQAFYAGKIALWCYLIPEWDIHNVTVAPGLTGSERTIGEKLLDAATRIYTQGMTWDHVDEPQITVTPDQEQAYPVTLDGEAYFQQVFTATSDTWVVNHIVNIQFQNPGDVPDGTRITDMNGQDITQLEVSNTGDGYSGQFKVLYPAASVEGRSGSVQLTLSADVYRYAVYYALCQETDEYGNLQSYLCDTDPQTSLLRNAISNYNSEPEPEPEQTALKITKYEAGTTVTLAGATFEVVGPDGDTIGIYTTPESGSITIPLTEVGNYTIYERVPPEYHLLDEEPVKQVTVKYGETAEVDFENEPYGDLRIEKIDGSTGASLAGAKIQIKHIESGATYSGVTGTGGSYTFTNLKPGAYEIQELAAPEGWQRDPQVHTTTVISGECVPYTLKNEALPGLKIIKYDRLSHETMSGVTFRIWRDGELLGDYETDALGEILLTDCRPGTYRVQEVDTGDSGHLVDSTPQEIELSAGDGIKKLYFFNDQKPGIWLVKVDSADPSKVIPNAKFSIEAVAGSFGPAEFTTDQNGYAYIDTLDLSGKVYLRELENEGYIVDEQLKTVYIKPGETTEITWENRAITGQIQIVKKSADYNPTNGLPAGTLLEGAVFEIYDKAGNLVDTIRSDSRGLAVSKPLPLSRYTIREVKAPANYGVNETELTAYLEHEGQIVKFEVTNKSLTTGVSITKTGPKEIMAGQPVRYTFSGIANTSNVRLDSFYWRDTLPAEVRLDTVVTGTYNFPGTYKITYRVNGGEYRTLADNLSTSKNYTLAASATALGLASNERITEVMFVFGQAPAGFAQVEKPYLHCTAVANLASTSFVNVADVGGVYNGQWVQAVSRWVTTVYGKPAIPTLPRTGY